MSFANTPVFNRIIFPVSLAASLCGGVVLFREYTGGKKCPSQHRMDKKVVIITGANSGIGKETATELAKRGATVIMGCRHMGKCGIASTEIKAMAKSKDVKCKFIDLANLDSVTEFAKEIRKEYDHVDVLVNNAGVMKPRPPKTKLLTEDGFEKQFGVNHLGHFLLTNLLLEPLTSGDSPSRIINVTSAAHSRGKDEIGRDFVGWLALGKMDVSDIDRQQLTGEERLNELYYQSKLANVLFTDSLSRLGRAEYSGRVTSNCVNPGVAHTNINRYANVPFYAIGVHLFRPINWLIMRTPKQASQTSVYLSSDEGLGDVTGGYYDDCERKAETRDLCDSDAANKLWSASEKWTKLSERRAELNLSSQTEMQSTTNSS